MPILNPLHLDKWQNDNITVIDAEQVKSEFMNIYSAINGGLDASNLQDGSITSAKLSSNSVTADKIQSVPTSKLTGDVTEGQLPGNLLTGTGGTVNGTITFQNVDATPFLKSYKTDEVVLLETGTGEDKITISVNPGGNLFQIKKGTDVIFSITNDGVVVPTKLRVPVI